MQSVSRKKKVYYGPNRNKNAFGQKLKFMHGMSFANFSKTNLRYDDPGLTLPDIPRPDPGSLEDEVLVTPDWH